jgi:hypothetical protein
MRGDCEVAQGISGNVSMRYGFAPRLLRIASHRRKPIKRRYRKRKHQLADDGHHKPKPDGGFQCSVRIVLQ